VTLRTEVIEAIERGIRGACSDIPKFTENWSGTLAAEYLLTVRVAEAIRDLNEHHGGTGFPVKVHLEERTGDFIRKCISPWPILKGAAARKRIYRAVERKGKVDIAVTHDSAPNPVPVPVCVIEIKGFDPAAQKVHEDLVRNANFMKVAALASRHEMFTSLVALHEGEAVESTHKDTDINQIRKKYRRAVRKLRSRLPGIQIECVVFTAGEEFPQEATPEELGDLEDSRHHFVGAIVSFYRQGPTV